MTSQRPHSRLEGELGLVSGPCLVPEAWTLSGCRPTGGGAAAGGHWRGSCRCCLCGQVYLSPGASASDHSSAALKMAWIPRASPAGLEAMPLAVTPSRGVRDLGGGEGEARLRQVPQWCLARLGVQRHHSLVPDVEHGLPARHGFGDQNLGGLNPG